MSNDNDTGNPDIPLSKARLLRLFAGERRLERIAQAQDLGLISRVDAAMVWLNMERAQAEQHLARVDQDNTRFANRGLRES